MHVRTETISRECAAMRSRSAADLTGAPESQIRIGHWPATTANGRLRAGPSARDLSTGDPVRRLPRPAQSDDRSAADAPPASRTCSRDAPRSACSSSVPMPMGRCRTSTSTHSESPRRSGSNVGRSLSRSSAVVGLPRPRVAGSNVGRIPSPLISLLRGPMTRSAIRRRREHAASGRNTASAAAEPGAAVAVRAFGS